MNLPPLFEKFIHYSFEKNSNTLLYYYYYYKNEFHIM